LLVLRTQPDVPNAYYRNNGDGSFTKITFGDIVLDLYEALGCAWGDYNADGYPDLAVANGNGPNFLYRNNGNGTFIKVTEGPIVTDPGSSRACAWADYDNDGHLDLFVANDANNFVYRNNGDGTFSRIISGAITNDGGQSTGSAWADYDSDGDQDLFVANTGVDGAENFLYQNNGSDNNWISIECMGTLSNRSAIGAKVRLKTTVDGEPHWQLREISGGQFSQNSLLAHFGLGQAELVDTLRIEWPSGLVQEYHDLDVNRFVTVIEPPTLSALGFIADNAFEMTITSRGGFKYAIQRSTNLRDWTTIIQDLEVNGEVQVVDPDASAELQFYRAIQPLKMVHGPVRLSEQTPEELQRDGVTVTGASIVEDVLSVDVVHSGGCGKHTYQLFMTPTAFAESEPPQATLYLQHVDHDDPCDGILNAAPSFDLRPVGGLHRQFYGSKGTILLNIQPSDGLQVRWDMP